MLTKIVCDDSDPAVYPGVVVGTKSCSSNNYYYVYGTASPTGTNYCRYRCYHSQDKICQSDGTISDPSCSSYSTYTKASCGTCKYAASNNCDSSHQGCNSYGAWESCGTCAVCDAGQCLTCKWVYQGTQTERFSKWENYKPCNPSNQGVYAWSSGTRGCGSLPTYAHSSIFYKFSTWDVVACQCY